MDAASGRPPGPTTFAQLQCYDTREPGQVPSCMSITSQVLVTGLPDGLGIGTAEPTVRFAGRMLPLPAACTTSTGEDVSCPTSHFVWEAIDAGADAEAPTARVGRSLADLEQLVRVEPVLSEIACSVEGVATTCRHRTWSPDGRALLAAVSGVATVREDRVAFLCSWSVAEQPAGTPSPSCRGVLALAP